MITYGQLFDAIEKNGLPKYRGDYFDHYFQDHDATDVSVISKACALGQGFINLQKEFPDEVAKNPYEFYGESVMNDDVLGVIAKWNDDTDMSLADIADQARKLWPSLLDQPFEKSSE